MYKKIQAPQILTAGTHNTTFPVEGKEDGQGYLSSKGKDSQYGLVVIQEAWGLNVSICTTTDTLAEQGFVALAPDIYRGKQATNIDEAYHLLTGLDWDGAVADIKGAVDYLKSLGCTKVGVTGFCMGGALTIAAMTECTNIDAGAPFYGIPRLDKYDLSKIKRPIFAHFAELDDNKGFSTVEDALNLEAKAKEVGIDITVKICPGVDHAFMNQDSPSYEKVTAHAALLEVTAFLNKVFKA